MLRVMNEIDRTITAIEASGVITGDDYKTILVPIFEHAAQNKERLNFLYYLGPNFKEFSLAAGWEDFKISAQYYKQVNRCAIVTDVDWLRQSTHFVSMFLGIPVKTFKNSELSLALDWIKNPAAQSTLDVSFFADKGLVMLEPHGSLKVGDFKHISEIVDPYIESAGGINGVVVVADKFPGWESLSAMKEHFSFVKGHHKYVKRVALVTDSKVMEFLPNVTTRFIDTDITVKEFPRSQQAEAIAWAQAG